VFAGQRLFRLRASGREYAWVSCCCGTSVARQCAVARCVARMARQVTVLAHGMPRREPTGSVRLRRPCRRRRAAVVPRTGRFSGVDQGRHVNHLLVGPPHLALNMCRLPGCSILSMRIIGNKVNSGRLRRWPGRWRRSGINGCQPGCCILLLHRVEDHGSGGVCAPSSDLGIQGSEASS
jgi:hypothetical protein